MKILHIITSLELGGAEKLLTELIPFQEKDNETQLFLLYDKSDFFRLPHKTSYYNKKSDFRNVFEILKEVRKGEYDIVHAHLFHAQLWTSIAARLDRKGKSRYITTEHSTSNRRREKAYFKILDQFIFSPFEKVVCISNAVRESLVKWLGDKRIEKYPIIENGIDLSIFQNAKSIPRSSMGLNDGDIGIIMAARFNHAKDHKTLIEALKFLPENYKVILAGEGETREEVENLVKKLNLESRVIFLGMRTDISVLFKTADIAVLSSHFEGFGLTAVEAMASGIPLVASDVPGLSEVVAGGGLLFEYRSPFKLANKIMSLNNEQYRNKVIESQIVQSNKYSLERTAEEYIKLYGELL